MKPGPWIKKLNPRWLLLSCLFIAILATACGTLQVDLAPTPDPGPRPGVRLTPTPWFGPAQFATEAGVLFDDRLNLVGYTVEPESAGPGSQITVTLIWEVLDKISAEYNTFVHMFNEEGQLLAQSDRPTGGGYRQSSDWIIKEYVYDQHHLVLPGSMSLDDVEIRIGLYDFNEGQRLDVESPNTYSLQMVASPTPDVPTPKAPTPRATETLQITDTPQIKETVAVPAQDPEELRVAYNKDGNAWIWDAGNGPVQLTQDGGLESVLISDDGHYIAFLRDQNIWVVDSDGGNERQLTNDEDFQGMDLGQQTDPLVTSNRLVHLAWRPDSHQVYFNTSPQLEGPGLFLSDDLWMADADSGEVSMILPPGEGGNFYFSPDGRSLAIVTPGRIDLMDAEGNGRREAFTHTPVITYSEFEYYAVPVWAPDSGSLRVAIPPADFLASAPQLTSIWYIPVEDRPPWFVGEVPSHSGLNRPPLFAPNLARVAYPVGDQPENGPESNLLGMAISELSESTIWDPVVYEAEVMNVHGWSPDGIRLLFTSPTATIAEIMMGQPGVKTLLSGEDFSVFNMRWIDNSRFLYKQQSGDSWGIFLGQVDRSDPDLIDSGTNFQVTYDFTWLPPESNGQ